MKHFNIQCIVFCFLYYLLPTMFQPVYSPTCFKWNYPIHFWYLLVLPLKTDIRITRHREWIFQKHSKTTTKKLIVKNKTNWILTTHLKIPDKTPSNFILTFILSFKKRSSVLKKYQWCHSIYIHWILKSFFGIAFFSF